MTNMNFFGEVLHVLFCRMKAVLHIGDPGCCVFLTLDPGPVTVWEKMWIRIWDQDIRTYGYIRIRV
jgi:hypothetical protein